jgi:DUF3060 family protein
MRTLIGLLIALTPAVAHAGKVYNEGSGGTWDCKKDPVVTINANKGTYTFKGACTAISVNGNASKVTIESVDLLSVNGNENTIEADSASRIAANGNENQVTYKSGTPKVSNLGTNNKIGSGAATKPAAKPADKNRPAPDAPGDASVIDCTKQPIQAIDSTGENTIRYTGTCTKITISTGSNRLMIENVKTLSIDGGENTVEIGGVDAIVLNGAENRVTYKKGLSGAKPKVSGAGSDNHVMQAK